MFPYRGMQNSRTLELANATRGVQEIPEWLMALIIGIGQIFKNRSNL